MQVKPDEFLGLTAEGWTAAGTWLVAAATAVLAAVTVTLVVLGKEQLRLIRKESLQQRTIAVCERWDTDPVLDQCLRRLSVAWDNKSIFRRPKRYRIDVVTILNFLETICTGIEVGVYDEDLVREFHEETIGDQIEDYINNGLLKKMGLQPTGYDSLIRVHKKWKKYKRPKHATA
jgi:hypothetical protein